MFIKKLYSVQAAAEYVYETTRLERHGGHGAPGYGVMVYRMDCEGEPGDDALCCRVESVCPSAAQAESLCAWLYNRGVLPKDVRRTVDEWLGRLVA